MEQFSLKTTMVKFSESLQGRQSFRRDVSDMDRFHTGIKLLPPPRNKVATGRLCSVDARCKMLATDRKILCLKHHRKRISISVPTLPVSAGSKKIRNTARRNVPLPTRTESPKNARVLAAAARGQTSSSPRASRNRIPFSRPRVATLVDRAENPSTRKTRRLAHSR